MAEIIDVATNIANVTAEIAAAARAAGRDPSEVALLAVSKTMPSERIEPALVAGQRAFGENRVQEAEEKWPPLRERYPDIDLHLIGPLQTNKAKKAVALFDMIETVDRPRLAHALAREMEAAGRRVACLIEVNTGAEPQKAGILPEEADAFIRECVDDLALPVRGLMCIPPAGEEPSPHFALLRQIARRNELPCLSMGMSADYPIAIALGATEVRVGTGVFGRRG